jgi:hypothetical protein
MKWLKPNDDGQNYKYFENIEITKLLLKSDDDDKGSLITDDVEKFVG